MRHYGMNRAEKARWEILGLVFRWYLGDLANQDLRAGLVRPVMDLADELGLPACPSPEQRFEWLPRMQG